MAGYYGALRIMNTFDILKRIGGIFLLLIGFSIVVFVSIYLLASVVFAIRFVVGVLKDESKDESSEEVGIKKQLQRLRK